MVKKRPSEDLDRALIAEFIDDWMPRVRIVGNISGLARESGVARTTINRILKEQDASVGRGTYARLDKPLELPTGTIHAIGRRDVAEAEAIGAPVDVLRWLTRRTTGGDAGLTVRTRG